MTLNSSQCIFSGLSKIHSVEPKSEKKGVGFFFNNYCSNKYMAEEFRLCFAKSDAKFMFTCIHMSGVHIVTDNNNGIKGKEMLQEVWEIVYMPFLK